MISVANPLTERDASSTRWTPAADWIAALALLALWLVSRPYRGVRSDAVLYVGQVLARLMPGRYDIDVFLHSSAQDRYSIFSPLMAPIVSHFGIGTTELVLIVLCHVLFLVAVWRLGEGWLSRPMRWAALMLVAVLPHTYGGLGQFSYAEPFLTARSFAEPFALFALGQLMRGRLVSAILLGVLALVFHPLITLAPLIVGWIVLIMRRRTWGWLGLLSLLAVALCAAGVAPFDALGHRFDDQWFGLVSGLTGQLFASSYGGLDWAALAFDFLMPALLLTQARTLPIAFVQLTRATLIAALALSAVWVIGADLLRNVLITELQPWRVYWLLHLLAMMALPVVLRGYWQRGWVGRWCAAALAAAGIAVMSNWATGWLCLPWALAALAAERWKLEVSNALAKGAAMASGLIMVMVSVKVAFQTLQAISHSPDNFGNAGLVLVVLSLPLVDMLIVMALLAALSARGGAKRVVAAGVAVAGVAFGLAKWDLRSPWQRRVEDSLHAGQPLFEDQIPPGASVYWGNDLLAPWLMAQRGNFFSIYQAAGLVFDRPAAMEYLRRLATMAPIDVDINRCQRNRALATSSPESESACTPSLPVLVDLCKSVVHPDYLAFPDPLPVDAIAQWHEGTPPDTTRRKSFYLYACAQLSGATTSSITQAP